ncbi:TonB-dependent siderophore receptor [Pantoea sp. Tr-811]|uniref:TonB-dependent siderophore receptor n=1 Tax=Pantoea sp. Tr-811 TaxID=2608361 RepID=UPI001420375E|nr:TonB-dependent siderophore receptor [Pantoea sp. Tr-811]NIF29957.1 TonB-dependent siderophore receptor [Pantoea sp. Tr-811]
MSKSLPGALNPLAKALLIRHSFRPQGALSRVGLGLALSGAMVAQVQAQEWNLDIPAQSVNSALQALAKQTDTQVLYSPEDVGGTRSASLKGRHDLASSLGILLAGTGLRYQIDGNTVTVTGSAAAKEGQVELSATNVNSTGLGATTEGTGSYTTGLTSTATKMNLSIRETPQTISVMTRQRMDDQQLHSMSEVLTQTPGITMSQDGGERFNIYSRGSQINTYQIDGVTTTQENQTRTMPGTLLDMALYDRVEIVRGATGLMTGAGDPSGVVNVIHKRPTAHFQSYVQGAVGSWDFNRLEADVSGPLTDNGKVRGRFVAAKQDNNSFMDWYSQRKDIVYGVVEADVTDSTLVRFGVDYQKYKATGSPGVPLIYNNGQQTNFSRSTSSGARWAFDEYDTYNYTLNVEQQLANDWQFTLAANYMDVDRNVGVANYLTGTGSSTLNPSTNQGTADVGKSSATQVQQGLDITLKGPFEAFGRSHDLIVGANYQEYDNDHFSYLGVGGSTVIDFNSWDNELAKPDSYTPLLDFDINSRQTGYFAATRLNFTDQLHLILGARGTDYSYNYYSKVLTVVRTPTDYHIGKTGVVTPYAGIVYDLTPEQSIYASYTDIFKPQSARDIDGKPLDPVLGKNYEVGWKGEFFDSRLNAAVAAYVIQRDNLAEATGQTIPDSQGESAYRAINGAKTKGVDLELTGEVATGWNVQAGYSWSRSEDADGNKLLAQLPTDTLRLWTTYRLPGEWDKLTVGGGVNWNSSTALYFSRWQTWAKQDDYYVASLMARYQVTDHLSTTLNVNNLFDEKYYAGFAGNYGHYGAPRNATVNLRYDF